MGIRGAKSSIVILVVVLLTVIIVLQNSQAVETRILFLTVTMPRSVLLFPTALGTDHLSDFHVLVLEVLNGSVDKKRKISSP